MQNHRLHPTQGLVPFSIMVVGISTLLFFYLYLGRVPGPEIHGLRKEIAESLGTAGVWALAIIYGRSLLKLIHNEGTLMQRIIPDEHYEFSQATSRKLLTFLNKTHKHVGATTVVLIFSHALLNGTIRWNPFLTAILCLVAWQGIFGLFLVVRFPVKTLKHYGRLVHAQLFTGVMIGVFAAFGHLLI